MSVVDAPPRTLRGRLRYALETEPIWALVAMIATLLVPSWLTLSRIHEAPTPLAITDNISPHGYSRSLTIFGFPVAVLAWLLWVTPNLRHRVNWRAFGLTWVFIPGMGFILDFFFAHQVFRFPNKGATWGLYLHSLDLRTFELQRCSFPIEELGFYVTGGWFILTFYVWVATRLAWRGESTDEPETTTGGKIEFWITPDIGISSAAACLLLIALAWLYKRGHIYPYQYTEGYPLYAMLIVGLFFFPLLILFRPVRKRINVVAFAFTLAVVVLISLMYEVTLGIPYGWWRYQNDRMMGLFIHAWSDLPFEAAFFWFAAGWGTVLSYEFNRAVCFKKAEAERKSRAAEIGGPAS